MLRPWPAKRERAAAVEAARREKETSRHGAAQAAALEARIRRMASENHFADLIASQIRQQHGGDGAP